MPLALFASLGTQMAYMRIESIADSFVCANAVQFGMLGVIATANNRPLRARHELHRPRHARGAVHLRSGTGRQLQALVGAARLRTARCRHHMLAWLHLQQPMLSSHRCSPATLAGPRCACRGVIPESIGRQSAALRTDLRRVPPDAALRCARWNARDRGAAGDLRALRRRALQVAVRLARRAHLLRDVGLSHHDAPAARAGPQRAGVAARLLPASRVPHHAGLLPRAGHRAGPDARARWRVVGPAEARMAVLRAVHERAALHCALEDHLDHGHRMEVLSGLAGDPVPVSARTEADGPRDARDVFRTGLVVGFAGPGTPLHRAAVRGDGCAAPASSRQPLERCVT